MLTAFQDLCKICKLIGAVALLIEEAEFANPFLEYLPYLEKADQGTLASIRKLLDMPEEEKREDASSSLKEAN